MTRPGDDDPTDILHDAVSGEATAAAVETADAAVSRLARRWWPWLAIACLTVSLLAGSAAALFFADLYAKQAQTAAAVSEVRRLAEAAKTAGDVANTELVKRGQSTVPIPQPGQAQDSDVLVAAATARVLASLPDRPTAGQIADAVASYMGANGSRFAPSPQQINESVADYLTKNPPPSAPPGPPGVDGKDGKDGADGHTPTEQEIQDAWVAYIRDHPDALCPKGGSFAQVRVQLADGGTADMWTCVVSVTTPPTTTSTSSVPLLPLGR